MQVLTIRHFGRQWYFKHAHGWGQPRGRAIRQACLAHIMPHLGSRGLVSLKASHVRRWLKALLAEQTTITVLFAAYTLRALLEAAATQKHLSASQWEELRRSLAHGTVMAMGKHHSVETDQ